MIVRLVVEDDLLESLEIRERLQDLKDLFVDLFGPILQQTQKRLHLEPRYHLVKAFLDVFLDLVLVIVENTHVFNFVLFSIFEHVAVLSHEIRLQLFELRVHDYLLQGGDDLVEKYFLRG